jgi:hypothetical protein
MQSIKILDTLLFNSVFRPYNNKGGNVQAVSDTLYAILHTSLCVSLMHEVRELISLLCVYHSICNLIDPSKSGGYHTCHKI